MTVDGWCEERSGAAQPDFETGGVQAHIVVDERVAPGQVASVAVLVELRT